MRNPIVQLAGIPVLAASIAYGVLGETFGFGAVANAWATRGRHRGWIALTPAAGPGGIGP